MKLWLAAGALAVAALVATLPAPRGNFVQLAPGIVELHQEMILEEGAELRGAATGTVLRAAPDFHGRALIVVRGNRVRLGDFTVDGNRRLLEARLGLPAYDTPFSRFTPNNGVLAEGVSHLVIRNLRFREISGFAILVHGGSHLTIDRVHIADSGSRNPRGQNNTTGGILLEEGVTDFQITNCELQNVLGNGIWTHSLYTSPRNARGRFADNRFTGIGRDALQVGHATQVRVEGNTGTRIGYPEDAVDSENQAIPVGVDTAGNVDQSVYTRNQFSHINGKCFDLDGFHDGEVSRNICISIAGYGIVMNNTNPDMQSSNVRIEDNLLDGVRYGGIFVIGTDNLVRRNRLLNLNTAQCGCPFTPGEPDMFRSGIYLGKGAERPAPARDNRIEQNEITGFQMERRCIGGAPSIYPDWNKLNGNRCGGGSNQ
ncbi:MAG: right-handed parallel beta-helix repeat-containing protein [Candidatus Solibacter sp.]